MPKKGDGTLNTNPNTDNRTENPAQQNDTYRVSKGVGALFDIMESLVQAVIIAIVMLTVFFRISIVDGTSMVPTLHNGDTLIISDFCYTPKTGDIVVVQPMTERFNELIIKRVIATGGQTVDIDFINWVVYVDGEPLELPHETYINFIDGIAMNQSDISFPHTVPQGKIFVMGDNRNDSLDSRDSAVGDIDEQLIVGRALYRILPFEDRKNLTAS